MKNFRRVLAVVVLAVVATLNVSCEQENPYALDEAILADKLGDSLGDEDFTAYFGITEDNVWTLNQQATMIHFGSKIGNLDYDETNITTTVNFTSDNPNDVFYRFTGFTDTGKIENGESIEIEHWYSQVGRGFETSNTYVRFKEIGKRKITLTLSNSLGTAITLHQYVDVKR